jgi:hypothetical protein
MLRRGLRRFGAILRAMRDTTIIKTLCPRPQAAEDRRPEPVQAKREDHPLNNLPEEPDWAETERRLEPQYVSFFQESMGMPEEVAREIFRAFAQDQKEAARTEGTDRLPELFGEILLEREPTDEEVRNAFAPKRAEGVTDEDIALWWNMHDLERRMICKVDEMNRILLFDKLVQGDGVAEPLAARMVAKRFPIYGNPDHLVLGNEDDRPLPFELKWRVNRYLTERTKTDSDGFRKETEASTSLNALLRRAVRQSKL